MALGVLHIYELPVYTLPLVISTYALPAIAPVAKSTIKPGQNRTIFAINAPALTFRAGSPAVGFVL